MPFGMLHVPRRCQVLVTVPLVANMKMFFVPTYDEENVTGNPSVSVLPLTLTVAFAAAIAHWEFWRVVVLPTGAVVHCVCALFCNDS